MGGVGAAAPSWVTGPTETGLGSSLELSPHCPWGHIPWAPWHQPGANTGVENEQQEGYRVFQGCLCGSCICM